MNLRLALLLCAPTAALASDPAITIYNNNFAVVRETVPLSLKEGVNHLSFGGATAMLEPDSVVLRDPSGKTQLQVLEQAYRSDAISQPLLLSMSEGKTLDFIVRGQNGQERVVRGEVVRSGYVPGGRAEEPIIRVDGQLRFELPGKPMFPSLTDDTILKPTLTWDLHSAVAADIQAELGYVTSGFSWESSYNLVSEETGDRVDVAGWVALHNQSGTTFREAAIKLMAGDVNHVEPERDKAMLVRGFVAEAAMKREAVVAEKAFDEYHLYSLPRPVTLRDGEMKQVEFMDGKDVEAKTVYVCDAQSGYSWSREYGQTVKIAVTREIRNSTENHLGLPFPAGKIRIYRRDSSDGKLEFVGEDRIDHTPKDETIRLKTGFAFDLTATRKMTSSSIPFTNERRETFEIALKNHKKTPVAIKVVEHVGAWLNWSISDNSYPFVKTDAGTIDFLVPVKPDETAVVAYTVTYDVP